ncbi:MAG TPA: hypothetical protein VF487_20180 [Chitinophagaceae bacterium]
MTNKELIACIAETVKTDFNRKVEFDDPITVKPTPHSYPVYIYGVEIGPQSGVWLMTGEDWHKLEETDKNCSLVASSIIQRLNLLSNVKN